MTGTGCTLGATAGSTCTAFATCASGVVAGGGCDGFTSVAIGRHWPLGSSWVCYYNRIVTIGNPNTLAASVLCCQ